MLRAEDMPRRTTLALGSLALNKLMALDKADLVLHEGVILGHPASDSIAVAGGKILALGLFDDFKPLVGPRTHLIRLAGRAVAPGLIDSHLHFLEGASAAGGLSLWRCRQIDDLMAHLRVAAGKTPPGNWLRAFGCDEALLAGTARAHARGTGRRGAQESAAPAPSDAPCLMAQFARDSRAGSRGT